MRYTLFGIAEDADKDEALACKAERAEDERLADLLHEACGENCRAESARRLLAQQLAERTRGTLTGGERYAAR